tara:strand:- start:816 stop:1469 length:654 start_codon:yes stop_codon:yes gene_type:complete
MIFKTQKYQVIKNAISYELANFIFNYFLLKREAVAFMYDKNIIYDTGMFGTWSDQQVPNTYSHYADFAMETLLMKVLPKMQKETGLELIPTYSYARIYKCGDILKRHKDRPSCEISTTLNLGGDPWPIFIDGTGQDTVIDEYKNIHKPNAPKGTKVLLDVGDMLVYSGCDLEHWREPFEGNICGQVFLHYNHVNGKFANKNKFDGRPMLGIPKWNFG